MKKNVRIISILIITVMVMSMTAVTAFAAQVGTFSISPDTDGEACYLSSTSKTVTYAGYLNPGASPGIVVLRFSNSSTYRTITFICDGTQYTMDLSLPAGNYTVSVIATNTNPALVTGTFKN